MDDLITINRIADAHITGMWQGGLGVALIIFGIIGWPATRYVLGVLTGPFTRRKARKPIGSKFWDKYNDPHWKPDFALHDMTIDGGKE